MTSLILLHYRERRKGTENELSKRIFRIPQIVHLEHVRNILKKSIIYTILFYLLIHSR